MKSFKTPSVLCGLILAAVAVLPLRAVDAKSVWASGGTDISTTNCYAVASAFSVNGGAPIVTYLNATSDKAASVVLFYNTTTQTSANYTNTTTSLPVSSTNGFDVDDVIIIRHGATDTYERRVVAAFTGATNLTVNTAPSTGVSPGDLIYKAVAAGSIPVGAATKELNGSGIYMGQRGKPLLLEIDGTSACQINAVAGTYSD